MNPFRVRLRVLGRTVLELDAGHDPEPEQAAEPEATAELPAVQRNLSGSFGFGPASRSVVR